MKDTWKIYTATMLALTALVVGLTRPIEGQQSFLMQLQDGPNLQSVRGATLFNAPLATGLTARNALGVQLVTPPSQWAVNSNPASGSQATASIAAEAGVRHVANCVGWSADASAAVTAAAGTIVVRDGASGAGTILQTWAIAHLVAAGAGIQTIAPQSFCGLSLVGTTATAMTIETNAGVTGEVQAVWITGINLQ